MRPPICAICGSRFSAFKGKGGTVYFTLTEDEKARKQKMKEMRRVGHPPGVEWFCEKHIDEAKSLTHLSRGEAISMMRKIVKKKPRESYRYRLATMADCSAIESLIQESTRALSKDHYSEEQIEAALQGAMGLDTRLIKDETYIVVESKGQLVGAGGWSFRKTKFGSDHEENRDETEIDPKTGFAKIRAFFVHPEHVRKGIAKKILKTCETRAIKKGFSRFELMATLPGKAFYEKFAYRAKEKVDYDLGNGLSLEFIPMEKILDA